MVIKKKDVAKLIESLNSLSFVLGLIVFLKTNSLTYGIIATVFAILLIQAVRIFIIINKKSRLRKSGIEEIDQMNGFIFEEYLSTLYKKQGYKVETTKASGDFGADLVLKKDGVKTVVQAKRYAKNVGIKAVQEIIGAINYYQANDSMVITNSYYTKAAIELARINGVKLIDRDQLIQMLLEVNQISTVSELNNEVLIDDTNHNAVKSSIPGCPKCQIQMMKKVSRSGNKFYGCANFPSCRKTMDYP